MYQKPEKIRYHRSIRSLIFSRLGYPLSAAVVVFWLGALSSLARAENSSEWWLGVEKGEGTESCPDTRTLGVQVERLLDDVVPPGTSVSVQFRHTQGTYAAEIRRTGKRDVRVLSDTHPDCGPLGSATATSIVLLLEMQEQEAPELPPEPPSESRPTSVPERLHDPLMLGISGRAGVAQGAMSTPGALVAGEALFGVRWFRTRIGALYLPPQREILGPGSVRQDLWAATAHLCVAPDVGTWLRLSACSGAYAGILSAEARGFTENSIETRPWFAVPLEASVSFRLSEGRGSDVYMQWGVTALFPRGREEFVVAGIEQSLRTWRMPVLVWVGISHEWEIATQ